MTTRRHRWATVAGAVLMLAVTGHTVSAGQEGGSPGPASWKGDLTPITAGDWSYDRAEHLLGRAGFSGTPEDIQTLANMGPEQAVRSLVYYDDISDGHLQSFVHSGFWDESLMPFPPSRPAATELAMKNGESMGIRVNTIMPGWVHTPFTDYLYTDPVQNQYRTDRVPLGRWGEPEDIAGGILFLASDDAAYMTGGELLMDGGVSAGSMRISNPRGDD